LLLTSPLDPEEIKTKFAQDPDWNLKYRKAIEYEMSDFMLVHKNTPALEAANTVYKQRSVLLRLR